MQIIAETANTIEMTQYTSEGQSASMATVMKKVVEKETSPNMSIFQNCSFGSNITF